jgi:hypothetical protein
MKKILTLIFILILLPVASFSQKDGIINMSSVTDFSLTPREGKAPNRLPYTPYHIEKEWNALAGDDLNFPFHMASAEGVFHGKPGIYTVCLNTLTERDGECAYNVYVNDKSIGLCQKNPPTNEFCAPAMLQWTGVELPANAKIRVESNSYSNLKRPEANFFEYARGRWTGIVFRSEQTNNTTSPNTLNPGIFEQCVTVGSSEIKTRTNYHAPDHTYYLIAGGSGLKDNQDSFGYQYKSISGDFALESCVKIIGLADSRASSAGLMMRQSTAKDAAFIACLVSKDGVVTLQYRPVAREVTKEISFKVTEAEMIQIERKGDSCTISAAKFGGTYERNSVQIAGFSDSVMIGFVVSSGSSKEKDAACFSSIRFFKDFSVIP